MGGAFFLSMLTTLLLGNILTAEEFGDFALLKNFILIGATFSIFGLDQGSIRRSIKGAPIIDYKIVNIISILLSAIFAVTMMILYKLSIMNFFFLWGIIFSGGNVLYLASVYRLSNNFAFAQLIHNCWKFLLFMIVYFRFFRNIQIDINHLYLYLFIALTSVIIIHYFFKSSVLKCGNIVESKGFSNNVIKDGMILWLINVFIAFVIFKPIDEHTKIINISWLITDIAIYALFVKLKQINWQVNLFALLTIFFLIGLYLVPINNNISLEAREINNIISN